MFCRKCGYELPEDSKFCPECGASLVPGATDQTSKKETLKAEKYDRHLKSNMANDPHRNDPRFVALQKYFAISFIGGFASALLIFIIWSCSDLGYDYQVRNFVFIGVVVGIIVDLISCTMIRSILAKAFDSVKVADTLLMYRRLEVKGVKYSDDDNIEFVDYFMDKYAGRSTIFVGLLLPFIATVFLYFVSFV